MEFTYEAYTIADLDSEVTELLDMVWYHFQVQLESKENSMAVFSGLIGAGLTSTGMAMAGRRSGRIARDTKKKPTKKKK